jgi:anthranilate synthase component 1
VEKAKAYIAAGEIFQVVLSQRLSRRTSAHPFSVYRALRMHNPSPYMVFMRFPGGISSPPLHIVSASPEMHVRLEDGEAELRPIAGTRWRGLTVEEDMALAQELLEDEKERAEHVMLVDLGRNDLGRVCEYNTVRVKELMEVERYSHVMHIVSDIRREHPRSGPWKLSMNLKPNAVESTLGLSAILATTAIWTPVSLSGLR